MQKVKLTQEEKELVKEIQELNRRANLLKMEGNKKVSDFFYLLSKRKIGNYKADWGKGEIYELSFEEIQLNNDK